MIKEAQSENENIIQISYPKMVQDENSDWAEDFVRWSARCKHFVDCNGNMLTIYLRKDKLDENVPSNDTRKQTVYKMEMIFKGTVALKEINDFMSMFGFNEELIAKDALTIRVTNTLPEVPNDDMIKEISEIIRTGYSNDELALTEVRFDGYAYIKPIEIDVPVEV